MLTEYKFNNIIFEIRELFR